MATAEKRRRFVNVDELQQQLTVEQVCEFYGVDPGEIHRTGAEIRTRCFLNCGKSEETGNRVLAIDNEHPAKQWKCHNYSCGKSGNLVGMCDLLKPGPGCDGKPRGQRFKDIANDLQAMGGGEARGRSPEQTDQPTVEKKLATPNKPAPPARPQVNVPLGASENERARELVNLDEQFVVDVAEMSAKPSSYFRHRPYLTPEVCHKWRMGYLPSNAKGLLRGKIIYPMTNEKGEVLCWLGRDPLYEEKHKKWEAGGKSATEPNKFQFPKMFHRGRELFGQQTSRLEEPGYRDAVRQTGILVVEGPNDVIALDTLGVPAVGLCSNQVTSEQVQKLAAWSQQLSDGTVTLMLDNDPEGQNGSKQALYELAQHCRVRLAWSPTSHDGKFAGRQPESLTSEEFQKIRDTL